MRRVVELAALAALTWATPLLAQEESGPGLPSDRIMAVVGDHILLLSEWRDQTVVLAQQLQLQPGTPEFHDLAVETFDRLVQDLVILAAAERDTTVKVSEDDVLEAVESELGQIRRRFPSEEEFLRQLSRSQWGTLAAYRADLQDRKRRELVGQAFIEAHRGEIKPQPVTDEEVRLAWERSRARIGATPLRLRFEEIPVTIEPSEEAREKARVEAERIKGEIMAGRLDFGDAARQYSDDESNRDEDGDLGWFGRGRMVEAFEEAAFEAALGEIVGPVATPFGMHLIQVIDRREDEVRARHVLVGYEFAPEDRGRAQARAEELRDRILAGADVDSLQAAMMPGDSTAAAVLDVERDRLPEVYARALEGLEPGRAATVETPTGYSVVVARGTAGGEEVTFEQAAPSLRQQLAQQKAEAAFVARLRETVYVEIRVEPEEVLASAP